MLECGPCMEQSIYIKRRLVSGTAAAEKTWEPLEERANPEQIAVSWEVTSAAWNQAIQQAWAPDYTTNHE